VNWSAPGGNPKGFDVFRCAVGGGCAGQGSGGGCNFPSTLTTTYIDDGSKGCGNTANNLAAGGPTMLMPGLQGIASGGPIVSTGPVTGPSHVSSSPNPAGTGVLRLASSDTVTWRNNANSLDLSLSKNPSDNLLFNGFPAYTKFMNCGTTSTCAQTTQTLFIVVNGGPVSLSGGTLTVTSMPFTSSTSYVCSIDDSTGANNTQAVYNSGSSVTFNGSGTDTIRYTCIGN